MGYVVLLILFVLAGIYWVLASGGHSERGARHGRRRPAETADRADANPAEKPAADRLASRDDDTV